MFESLLFLLKVFFVASVSYFLMATNATELNSNEKEAKQFASETSDRILEFYKNTTDGIIKIPDNPNLLFLDFNAFEFKLDECELLADIAKEAKNFVFKNFNDKQLKYAFEKISKLADDKIVGRDRYFEILKSLERLMDSYEGKSYFYIDEDDYDINFGVPRLAVPQAIEVSNNLNEIEFFWNEVRGTCGQWTEENFKIILKGLKDAANISDTSPLDFWLRHYNLTQIENLMTEIQPLYKDLHAFIRNGLRKKYGDSIITPDGLIPHHLFDQVIIQAWSNGSILEEMFPYKDLPSAKYVSEKKFKTMKIADSFWQKLGFTPFPNEVWEDHIKIKTDPLYEIKNDIFYQTPNVHLEFWAEMNFGQLMDSYSDMGKLYYAKEMTGQPAYFFPTYNLEHAIGKAAILSASSQKNFRAIGVISDMNKNDAAVEMNKLVRRCIESLLKIPVEFVHIKLMEHILTSGDENIDKKDINKKYWDLIDKYVGVKRPNAESKYLQYLDLPPDFYYDMKDNVQSRKFDSEILSYQIHKKLCELAGKFPKEPLHICDISGSKAAGDALKNMMRLGSSKPLKEVMATMFPEDPTTRAEGILEYYSPVKKFLAEKKTEAKVKPGWKHSEEDSPVSEMPAKKTAE